MFVAIGCSIDGTWTAYDANERFRMGGTLDEYVKDTKDGALMWDARWTDPKDHEALAGEAFGRLFNDDVPSDFGAFLKQHISGIRIGRVVRSGALPYVHWDITPEEAAIAKAHREHRRLGFAR